MDGFMLLSELRESYHKLIQYEYDKFKRIGKLGEVHSTYNEIVQNLGIRPKVISELQNRGFLVSLDKNLFRSLLFDVAFRISDIRIQYGGTKYVLE